MTRVIIAHRWSGGPTTDWYPWLKKQLEAEGLEVTVPEMGDTDTPTITEWTETLSQVIDNNGLDTVVVAHSISTQTTMRYLESAPRPIKGAVFVAPWFNLIGMEDEEVEAITQPWIETPIDFEKVKENIGSITAFFSDNDQYVPLSDEQLFVERLDATTHMMQAKGHFAEHDGVMEFPEVRDIVLEIVK